MAAHPFSGRLFPLSVRALLVIIPLLLLVGITSSIHSDNNQRAGSHLDNTSATTQAQTLDTSALRSNFAQSENSGDKPDLIVEAARPIPDISAEADATGSNAPIQVKLGDVVAYSGLLQDNPTSTATDQPAPPGLDSYTPLVPQSTPTIYVTNVDGRFFYGASPFFVATTETPPAFTQVFPLINFNTRDGFTCNATPITDQTRPLTDVDEGNPCALITAQATAPPPTPTLLQAGMTPLAGYQAVYLTDIYVSEAADISFYLHSDNAFVFGVGPLNGVPGNPQPIRISGAYFPTALPFPTPYPTTNFRNLMILGRRNDGTCCSGEVTVRFPDAGFYPIEIDNSEDGNDGLYITLESPSNTPVPNGPSPTPTCYAPTPVPYPWCDVIATATASPTAPVGVNSYYVQPTSPPRSGDTATPTTHRARGGTRVPRWLTK